MTISKEDVLEYIAGLSVLELSELVAEFEQKFGISAQPMVVVSNSDSGSGDSKDFDVCQKNGAGGFGGFKAIGGGGGNKMVTSTDSVRKHASPFILKKSVNSIGYNSSIPKCKLKAG